jgi:hypothetical protein
MLTFSVVAKGEFFSALDCVHLKNKVLFLASSRDTIAEQILAGTTLERKKKLIQFASIFFLLQDGRPMADYSGMKDLMWFLHVSNCSTKHWAKSIV